MKMIRHFLYFLRDLLNSRELIMDMTRRDFRAKYLGSYLGLLWAFVNPVVTICVFWFVFQVGFKSVPVDNFPFVLWLVAGMVPWFFISESISSATGSVIDYSFLVKKVVFRVSALPIIKILSALFVHIFFIFMTFALFLAYGYGISIYNLQVFYYLFCALVLITGIAWTASALVVFLRDIGQLIAMLLQLTFWATPVFWSIRMLPEKYHFIIKLNPVFYIVNGYRNSFVYKVWFWESPAQMVYFWAVALLAFGTGALVFHKVRPHFADVL